MADKRPQPQEPVLQRQGVVLDAIIAGAENFATGVGIGAGGVGAAKFIDAISGSNQQPPSREIAKAPSCLRDLLAAHRSCNSRRGAATRLPVRSSPASAELEEERCASRDAIAPHGLSNETRFDPHPLGVEGLSRSTDDVPAG